MMDKNVRMLVMYYILPSFRYLMGETISFLNE